MTNDHFYITTAIPYVNGAPHLGHALELVQADVLARHQRSRGRPVRFLTGTDDNALKNVTAARAAGVTVREFVTANASRFAALQDPLALSFDDFISTSRDARHRPGVEQLWRRIAARGDFYRRRYEGLYCGGCEQFYTAAELDGGRCPEHGDAVERVSEENWFFRLSRYAGQLLAAVESGDLRVEPRTKRNEVLAFLRAGLDDISVSRPSARAGGWGIPVPDDPEQVVYVWWDALANYVTALGFGTDTTAYDTWWLLREVPLVGDVDFTRQRLADRNDRDLANSLGNLANRTVTQVHKFRDGAVDLAAPIPDGIDLLAQANELPAAVDGKLSSFDFRAATAAILAVVDAGNRLVEAERPWELARLERAGDAAAGERLDAVSLRWFAPAG